MRFLLSMSYDGSEYAGFQRQVDKRTIQGEIEKALKIILNENVTIQASGRTDASVHAIKQVAHFDSTKDIEDLNKFKNSLNSLLPHSIAITEIAHVDDNFHARYNSKKKTYLYKILLSKEKDPFKQKYYYTCGYNLDLDKMQQGCDKFLGKHDFTSYCVQNPQIKCYERTIFDMHIEKMSNELHVYVTGDGFLHNMVRCMVGTLIDVARGRFEIEDIDRIFLAKDHQKAGKTITGAGLYLYDVVYD